MNKPRILITTSNVHANGLAAITGDTQLLYSDSATSTVILNAGGLPLYMPATKDISIEDIEMYIDEVDGVLLTGADTGVNPVYYGEDPHDLKDRIDDERDHIDLELVRRAVKKKIPLFGICKGAQLINVALGGTLYQDISTQCKTCFTHEIKKTDRSNVTHNVTVSDGSFLKELFNKKVVAVNSSHSQAVKKLARGLKPTAIASDGIVEGFESKDKSFIVGVQFHAELRSFDPVFNSLFQVFVEVCRNT